jgi:hypothetical protein
MASSRTKSLGLALVRNFFFPFFPFLPFIPLEWFPSVCAGNKTSPGSFECEQRQDSGLAVE